MILKRKNKLDEWLSLFAPVHSGEAVTALLLMLNVFTLLTAYYIIKPVREALILGSSGAEIKSYAGAAQAALLLFIVPLYSAYATRVSRIRLINGVTAFFISNLAIFYVLSRMKVSLGIPFFLWVGLFNVMLLAQFWAFANDVYTEEQGKRLFAIVGIGSSLGAIFGAWVAGLLFKPLGVYPMMLIAAGLLGICMALTNWIHHREGTSSLQGSPVEAARHQPIGDSGGFRLVFQHRYLLLIAALVLVANFVNTTGEFLLGKMVIQSAKGAADGPAYIGQFYAGFFFWVNVAGAAFQMFAVSRILKHLGISIALFCLPLIALGSYSLMAFVPLLTFIRIGKIAENSTDYSLQNTTRHALFLNTSRESKYKAQSAIESFFCRAGDGFSALLVFIGTRFAFNIRHFAVTNVIFVLVWLALAAAIARQRKRQNVSKEQVPAAA